MEAHTHSVATNRYHSISGNTGKWRIYLRVLQGFRPRFDIAVGLKFECHRLTCPQYSGALATNQSLIPSDLSFIFSITSVRPNYNIFHVREGPYFVPPTTSDAFLRVEQFNYRWIGGLVARIQADVTLQPTNLQHYLFSAATVFTQMPDTPHLLAVDFDAETVNVSDRTSWRPLSFDHVRTGIAERTYSSVSVIGSQQHLAAPGARQWVPQLLPNIYDYQPRTDDEDQIIPPHTTSAGLIGSLPLLLALAVFSGPARQLDTILTHFLGPGVWLGHSYPRDSKTSAFLYHA